MLDHRLELAGQLVLQRHVGFTTQNDGSEELHGATHKSGPTIASLSGPLLAPMLHGTVAITHGHQKSILVALSLSLLRNRRSPVFRTIASFRGKSALSINSMGKEKRRWLHYCSAALMSISMVATAQSRADLIVVHGKIWTEDPHRPEVEALAVRDQRIMAAGDSVEIQKLAGEGTKVIDLRWTARSAGIQRRACAFLLGRQGAGECSPAGCNQQRGIPQAGCGFCAHAAERGVDRKRQLGRNRNGAPPSCPPTN